MLEKELDYEVLRSFFNLVADDSIIFGCLLGKDPINENYYKSKK